MFTLGKTHSAWVGKRRGVSQATRHRRSRCITLLLAASLVAAWVVGGVAAGPAGAGTSGNTWPSYLDGLAHDSYNAAATSITPTNAATIEPVWQWFPPASPNAGTPSFLASPTVYNGVIYVGAWDGEFYAVSEATQQILWSQFLGFDTPKGGCGTAGQGIISTATVATDPATGNATVYVFAPNGDLYAMNAATGAILWNSVVDTPSSTQNDYYSWSSPAVANNTVYVGISSDCDNPLVSAGLMAFNQSTGEEIGEWHSLPPNEVGASIWSSPSVLPGGTVIVTTGNAYPNSGQPLYNESVVRLNGTNLQLLDAWQVPKSQQVGDGDFGGSPTQFTADVDGTETAMVGACNKNGEYYAFAQDDLSAGPVWKYEVTEPYPGGSAECDAAAVWNGTSLIEGGGAPTTIGGTEYMGSLVDLNPATGSPIWQTGLNGSIVGSPSEDGGGVVAAQTLQSPKGDPLGVYLVNAANGGILNFIPTSTRVFSQPVFVGKNLLISSGEGYGITDYQVTTAGAALTSVSPSVVAPGTTKLITVKGSGFTGTPNVVVTGGDVVPTSVKIRGPKTLTFDLKVRSGAVDSARNIAVDFSNGSGGYSTDSCTDCLTIGATG